MKKLLIFIFLLSSIGFTYAQEETEESGPINIYAGVKGGYGISNFESTVKNVNDFAKMKYTNLLGGVVVGYKLNDMINIQLEGNYAQYGARDIKPEYVYSPNSPLLTSAADNVSLNQVNMTITNIDVPLTVQLKFGEGGMAPYVYAGANWGINFTTTTLIKKDVTDAEIGSTRTYNDITDRIIQNEFAPIVGAGVTQSFGNISVMADARYKHGLTNLNNIQDSNLGFTNQALYFSVAIVYSF